jgi:hypothetical protein
MHIHARLQSFTSFNSMRDIQIATLVLSVFIVAGCNRERLPEMSTDTLKPAPGSYVADTTLADTTKKATTDTVKSDLPPIARAIEPDRLAQFLPHLTGWTPTGELQKEIQIHDKFNKSRVEQDYVSGDKKVKVEINDYAYVPYLYEPWSKFKGTYIDDDNIARTETSTLGPYHVVQSMEKKDPHAEVTVFPGKRFIVRVVEDGSPTIDEARTIAQQVDLRGLEAIQ